MASRGIEPRSAAGVRRRLAVRLARPAGALLRSPAVKSVLTAICLVALALTSAGCGGSDTSASSPTPRVQYQDGQAFAYVADDAEAESACEALQADWSVDADVVYLFRQGTRDNLASCGRP